jgi:hypothetical protein
MKTFTLSTITFCLLLSFTSAMSQTKPASASQIITEAKTEASKTNKKFWSSFMLHGVFGATGWTLP